uniref:Protein goliath n=3 Tax=Cacopsylla melanoneura TaxID=428564 RepID=A0A8D8S394_9HEMI
MFLPIMTFLYCLLLSLLINPLECLTSSEWGTSGASYTDEYESYTTAYINITYRDGLGRVHSDKSEIGKFGEAHVGYAVGILVHVKNDVTGDASGCHLPLKPSFGKQFPRGEPWIALVKRGGCNFQIKVNNAAAMNATGIIVYNDRESNNLDKMKLTKFPQSRNMSAVFTYKWKGEELARLLDNGTRIIAKITIASHCNRPYTNINRTSVLFVSISFIVLMIISLAWLIFYYVQRFRYIHAKDRLSRRLCSAAKKALSKIPTKHIKGEDKECSGDGECCAICIEFYKTSDVVRILPCKHEYHKGCIDPWLLEHRTCPMCKMDILKHYGFVFTGSQESILHMDSDDVIFDSPSFPSNLIGPIRTSTIVPVIHSSRMLSVSEESRSSSPNELTPALNNTINPGLSEGETVRAHSSIGTSPTDLPQGGTKGPSSLTPTHLRRSFSMDHIFEIQSPHQQRI